MEEQATLDARKARQARELAAALEEGNDERAAELLDGLTGMRQTELFQQVGRLTRQLHDALVRVALDGKLSDLAERGMPDAKERLSRVIEMTEAAAHKTMSAVEGTILLCRELEGRSAELKRRWGRFMSRETTADKFGALARELGTFMDFAERQAGRVVGGLNEILLAQDYQDLSGQAIKRVIVLVQEVEDGLVDLIRVTGFAAGRRSPVAGHGREAASVGSQDEVDELLSSLGF